MLSQKYRQERVTHTTQCLSTVKSVRRNVLRVRGALPHKWRYSNATIETFHLSYLLIVRYMPTNALISTEFGSLNFIIISIYDNSFISLQIYQLLWSTDSAKKTLKNKIPSFFPIISVPILFCHKCVRNGKAKRNRLAKANISSISIRLELLHA